MLNLEDKSPEDLERLILEAQSQLETRISSKRKEVIAQIKQLAASIGVSVDIQEVKGRKVSSVESRYRDPNDPLRTWTGRGLPPKWMQALLAAGHAKDEFLINK